MKEMLWDFLIEKSKLNSPLLWISMTLVCFSLT